LVVLVHAVCVSLGSPAVSFTLAFGSVSAAGKLKLDLVLHFHVHEDFNARFYVLKDGERVRLSQSFSLLCQHVLVVGIDLDQGR